MAQILESPFLTGNKLPSEPHESSTESESGFCERATQPTSESRTASGDVPVAVGGGWAPNDDFGRFMVSAGTTPDRASETVQVVEQVINGIKDDPPSQEEIDRAKEGVLSALTLRRESTSARAGALGNHFTTFGEIWDPTKELQAIQGVNREAVLQALSDWDLGDPWAVALGPTDPFSEVAS